MDKVIATMKADRITKGKIRFQEVLVEVTEVPVVETIYIPKSTLQTLGWTQGQRINITIEVEG